MAIISKSNMSKPAPRWLRITDGIIGDSEDVVLAILLIKGYTADAPALLMYKLISSFVRRQLARFISNGEEYAPSGTTQTLANVTNTPVETKETVVLPTDSTLKLDT